MAVIKPTFPTITPTQLQKGFDELSNTMEEVRQKNGRLDLRKLQKAVSNSDNNAVKLAFQVIKDEYKVETRVWVSGSGCGGGHYRTTTKNKIETGDVDTVLAALVKAKQKAGRLDKDGNKVIDGDELKNLNRLQGISGRMVQAAAQGEVKEYVQALRQWQWTLRTVADTIDERHYREDTIDTLASFHCKHKNGARAMAWSLRAVATRGDVSLWQMEENAKRMVAAAETSDQDNPLLRYFDGTFDSNRHSLARGHLDNHEVRDILNENDLGKFEKKMKGIVSKQITPKDSPLMSYTDYLAGKDLAGVEQLDDPDRNKPTPSFMRTSDTC